MKTVQAALYARVSSDQQSQAQTIQSQLAALRARVQTDDAVLSAESEFIDEGYGGSTLVRPALDRLRVVVATGGIDRLYVHSPDRLAHKYTYQMVLVVELQCAGVEVIFLNQGSIAENGRSKILERSHQSKRHKAQMDSVNVLSEATYGYRSITLAESGGQARYEICEEQAQVVRQVFIWVGRERLSIGEVCRRLRKRGMPTHTGKTSWDHTNVRKMLKNPAYKGQACFSKTRVGDLQPRFQAQCKRSQQPRSAGSSDDVPATDWLMIPVPAIISEDLFAAVQTQLEDPQHLGQEYERPLEAAQAAPGEAETTLVQKQISKLHQGIARLIDGCTEGYIDKREFEPRIRRFKERLAALGTQAKQLREHSHLQAQLRLINGRLEEFSAIVKAELGQLDWHGRQEWIQIDDGIGSCGNSRFFQYCKGLEAPVSITSMDWAPWLIPATLVPLILWGNPLLAIITGAGLSLTLDRPLTKDACHYSKFTLQSAIVLLGFNLDAQSMWEVSRDYAGLIALYVLITLGAGIALGRLVKVDGILTRLIATGSAICGGTAIATLSPILKARADQLAVALAIVFALNMLALIGFPVVGHWLSMSQTQFGIWSALAVHDTSSVVATAAVYGDQAAEVATTLKLGRTLWLIPLVLIFSLLTRSEQTRIRVPGFIGLFILASVIGSLARAHVAVPQIAFDAVQHASKALIVVALFFIGMEFTRQTVKNLQGRVIWHALLLWAAIVPLTLLAALNVA